MGSSDKLVASGDTPGDEGSMKLKLRQLREERGLSLEQVAQAIGTTRASVSRWELHGFTGLEKLERCADFFGVSVADLLDDAGADESGAEMLRLFNSLPAETRQTLLSVARQMRG